MIHTLVSGSALAVALVFTGAVLSGARRPAGLAAAIDAYRLLPEGSGRSVAWMLVSIEAVTALLLVAPSTRLAGAVIATLLVLLFVLAIALNLIRGSTDFDCGCGGFVELRPDLALLLRNLLLLMVCAVVMMVPPRSLDAWQCAVASVLFVAWHFANALIADVQWPRDD